MDPVARLDEATVEPGVLLSILELVAGVLETRADRERSGGVAELTFPADAVPQAGEHLPEHPVVETGDLERDRLRRLRREIAAHGSRHGQSHRQRAEPRHQRLRAAGAGGARSRPVLLSGVVVPLAASTV